MFAGILAQRGERLAVRGAGAELAQRATVKPGPIALVLAKAVVGELVIQRVHELISHNFGEDAGRRDAQRALVTPDQWRARQAKRGQIDRVHKERIWWRGERVQRAAHGEAR